MSASAAQNYVARSGSAAPQKMALSESAAGDIASRIARGDFGAGGAQHRQHFQSRQFRDSDVVPDHNDTVNVPNSVNSAVSVKSSMAPARQTSRADRIREACSTRGFAGDQASDLQAVAVLASHTTHQQAKSIGAPASTSLIADPGQLSVTTPTNPDNGPWGVFFGEGQYPYKSRYDEHNTDTWTLPQALFGQTPRISETIEQLVFLDGNWYTEVVAPIQLTNALSVKWSSWEFNPHLTDIVPELGVNRLVTSSRQENSARFTRRAIGFMLEHGFMRTELGIIHYLQNVNQLVQAAIETNKFDVIFSLLTAHDQNKDWLIEQNLFAGKRAEDVLRRGELFNWDTLKKRKNGMEILDTKITHDMNQWRGEADTYIIHPAIANFLTQVPAEKTDFFLGGAAAPQRLLDGPEAFTSIRGNQVYMTRAFHVDEDGPVDIMAFPTQIGEYHLQGVNHYESAAGDTEYRSSFGDIQYYDEDRDKFVTQQLATSLATAMRFDSKGKLVEWADDELLAKFSDAQRENDQFHYRDIDGKLRLTPFFVNIKHKHMTASSRLLLGKTVKQQLKGVKNIDRVDELLASVREAVRQMEEYDADTALPFLAQWQGAQGAAVSSNRVNRAGVPSNLPATDLNEYEVNTASGANTLPEAINVDNTPITLPPGYQSWAGLKEIARVSRIAAATQPGGTLANASPKLLADIRDFVDTFQQIVAKLRRIFKDSLVLQRENASSWWQRPGAEDVLFNNFVHKYRVPLWSSGGAAAAAVGGLSVAASAELLGIFRPIAASATTTFARVTGAGEQNALAQFAALMVEGAGQAGQSIGLADLTPENYGESRDSIFGYLVVLALVGLLPNGEPPAITARKIADINAEIARAAGQTPDGLKAIVADAETLFAAVGKLAAKKPAKGEQGGAKTFFEAGRSSDSIQEALMTVFAKLNELAGRVGGSGFADSSVATGDLVRTTLLAAPRLVQGLAALAAQGAPTPFVPSNPGLPDINVSFDELRDLADVTSRDDAARPAAFVEESLLGAGNVSTSKIEDLEFVQMVNALEAYGKARESDADGGSFDDDLMSDSIFGSPRASRRSAIGADMEVDFSAASIGRSAADVAADRNRARISDARTGASTFGGSRAGLGQGISDFVSSRDALLSKNARDNFLALAEAETDGWAYIFASVFNYTPVNEQAYQSFIRNNVLFPARFIIARPHAEYEACYIIKLKRGNDTVTTFQRRGEFMTGDDVNVGAHTGHYRYYSKVIVTQPKNVVVVRAVFIKDYLRGLGSEPYTKQDYRPHDASYGNGSYFSYMVGYEEDERVLPPVINVSGSNEDMELDYDLAHQNSLHFSSAPYYNGLWGYKLGRAAEIDESKLKYANQRAAVNQNMLKGTTKRRDFASKEFNVVDSGQGHWKDEATYNNCGAARRGEYTEFKMPNQVGVVFT